MADEIEGTETGVKRPREGTIAVYREAGGVQFSDVLQMMDFARLMSKGGPTVPAYLRENPGACLYIVTVADEWKLSAYQLANASYVMENKSGDLKVAFESSVYHAVLNRRLPLEKRLTPRYEGEGEDRICIVSATLKGGEVLEWPSGKLKDVRPRRNDKGYVKGSPLWDTKPDLQLFYNTRRDFARVHFPDVMMGTYTQDELEELGWSTRAELAKDVTPEIADSGSALHQRLSATAVRSAGFDPQSVETVLAENGHGPRGKTAKAADAETVVDDAGRVTKSRNAEVSVQHGGGESDGDDGLDKTPEPHQEAAPVSQDGQDALAAAAHPAKDEAAPSPSPTSAPLTAGGASMPTVKPSASPAQDAGSGASAGSPTAPPKNEAEYLGRALAEILLIETEADLVAWDKAQKSVRNKLVFEVTSPTFGKIRAARDARLAQIREKTP